MSEGNGKTRIEVNIEEIEAIRFLVRDKLKGSVRANPKLRDETLGGLLIKLGRAGKRVAASG